MRRWIAVIGVAAALGCGEAERADGCAVSTDCPAGQACVAAGGERVCWADGVPPAVANVNASCGGTCPRDGTLLVTATVTDDREVLDATAEVGFAGTTRTFPMARGTGTTWTASVPLRDVPFPAADGAVTATVSARDGARNASAPVAGVTRPVTRVKEAVTIGPAGFTPTPPAMLPNGTVVLGGPAAKLYFVAPSGAVSSTTIGTGTFAMGTPAVGTRAIWVGSEDGWLYGVNLDGSGRLTDVGVNTQGAVSCSIAVRTFVDKEVGFAASASGRLGAASSVPLERATTVAEDFYTTTPVLDRQGRIHSVGAAANLTATRRCYPFDGSTFGSSCGTAAVGLNVIAPIAVDAEDNVWSGSQDGRLFKSGAADAVATLPGVIIDSPVILPGGDVVVGDQSGLLHRLTPAGAAVWDPAPNVGAPVLAPLVLRGGDAVLVVPTRTGKVVALRGDGTTVWEATLGPGELRTGNIHTPPGQPAGKIVSTVYFPSTDGKLHALLVDGELDTSAPWPKAFHDARNTSNAGTQP